MSKRDITFNSISASSLGLRIGGVSVYGGAAKRQNPYIVPGRFGEVFPPSDYTDIANEIREYTAGLYLKNKSDSYVADRMAAIRNWLFSPDGYAELTDNYEPLLWRKAVFSGDFAPVRKGSGNNFVFPLTFSCDPRRFVIEKGPIVVNPAEGPKTITPGGLYYNYQVHDTCYPLININKFRNTANESIVFTDTVTNTEIGRISLRPIKIDFVFDSETLTAYDPTDDSPVDSAILDITGDIRLGPNPTKISFETTNNPAIVYMQLSIVTRMWVR